MNDGFNAERAQVDAWKEVIAILRSALYTIKDATIYLEFNIPRMGRRIDAILLIHSDKPHLLGACFISNVIRIASDFFVHFAGFEGEYSKYLTEKRVKWAEKGDVKMVAGLVKHAPSVGV